MKKKTSKKMLKGKAGLLISIGKLSKGSKMPKSKKKDKDHDIDKKKKKR